MQNRPFVVCRRLATSLTIYYHGAQSVTVLANLASCILITPWLMPLKTQTSCLAGCSGRKYCPRSNMTRPRCALCRGNPRYLGARLCKGSGSKERIFDKLSHETPGETVQ